MTELSTEEKPKSKTESFSDLFEKSFEKINNLEGSVVEGRVISVEKEAIIVDIGLKSEGRILKREFGNEEKTDSIKIGDLVEVYIERIEDINEFFLSRDILICREITKYHEEYIRTSVNELSNVNFSRKGELTVVISETKKEKLSFKELEDSD